MDLAAGAVRGQISLQTDPLTPRQKRYVPFTPRRCASFDPGAAQDDTQNDR
jgi:hypothetical protein